jgi:hypothetical protein
MLRRLGFHFKHQANDPASRKVLLCQLSFCVGLLDQTASGKTGARCFLLHAGFDELGSSNSTSRPKHLGALDVDRQRFA